MIGASVSNVVLATQSTFYGILLLGQILFYATAGAYAVFQWMPKSSVFRLPSFFVLVNLSILDAWMRYFRGDRVFRWEPSKR
jgi:hypothetical protein